MIVKCIHFKRGLNDGEKLHFVSQSIDSARLLREHCSRHVVNLKCERCAIMVGSPSALHRHILTVHKQKLTLKQKLYRCC